MRGLLPVCRRLPGGLHRLAGDSRLNRAEVFGLFPDQFLAMHLLRLLRGSLPDLRHPVDAGFRDGRVQPAEPGLRERGFADQR